MVFDPNPITPATSGSATASSPGLETGLEICTVGTELLLGDIVDTNAAYIARRLASIGVNVYYRSGVGDNLERIQTVIRHALSRCDGVILTGGLGPTRDDITVEALAGVFDEPIVQDPETEQRIRDRVERLGMRIAPSTYRMAMIPRGATALTNPVGAAPGIWIEKAGKIAIALPGVPSEMRALMDQEVIPRLQARTSGDPAVLRSRVLRMVGIAESLAEEKILDLIDAQSNPTIAPYIGSGELKIRITARAATEVDAFAMIAETETAVRARLGSFVFGVDEETMEISVGRLLLERGLRIATAESCTAGLLTAALTELPGSSGYFVGGEITYSDEAKQRTLSVPAMTLETYGAVSAQTAAAMAEGVRNLHRVDIGISITGIAGPGGGSTEKPVGLVHFGYADSQGVDTEQRVFGGPRSEIRQRSVIAALQLLLRKLRD